MPVQEVGLNVPFSEYGGDSLLAVEVLSQAARQRLVLGAASALTADFEMLSIQDLVSRAVGSGSAAKASAGKPGSGSGTSALSAEDTVSADLTSQSKTRPLILERSKHTQGASPKHVGGISACAQGDLVKIVQLARGGWDAASAVDKHGNTPLMWAAGAGHLPVVQWLVTEQNVDVEESNKQGRTALMWAAKNGQVGVVDWLLSEAPPPRADAAAQMKDGSRAFDWAIYGGHLPTLRYLASRDDVDIHALNNYGCGAAFWAAASGKVPTCLCPAPARRPISAHACLLACLMQRGASREAEPRIRTALPRASRACPLITRQPYLPAPGKLSGPPPRFILASVQECAHTNGSARHPAEGGI